MKINLLKTLFFSFTVFLFTASLAIAQDSAKETTGKHITEIKKEIKMDHNMNMDNNKDSDKQGKDSSIVHSGIIDLKTIDENKDGKVYQCQMDYNVLSDKPGTDPKCGMKLEKVSLKKARANLMKAGFKVK